MLVRTSVSTLGNRYDVFMVIHDVNSKAPGGMLVERLHVDLCRLCSAI